MKEKTTQSPSHPVEVWYRVTFADHYYPPIREMKVQRSDLKDERGVKENMNRLIRQGAYASIILTLCIFACIFIAVYAAYMQRIIIKDIICFAALIGISYLGRIDSIKQKKVSVDFWNSALGEDDLKKRTNTGRIYVTLLFVAFLALTAWAFHDMKF